MNVVVVLVHQAIAAEQCSCTGKKKNVYMMLHMEVSVLYIFVIFQP